MPEHQRVAMAHLSRVAQMNDEEREAYTYYGAIPRYRGAVTMQCHVCGRDVEVGPKLFAEVQAGTPLVCFFDARAYAPAGGTAILGHLGGNPSQAYEQGMG